MGNERYSRRTYREIGLTPFRLDMERQGKTARVEVTLIDQVTPPFDVAERLIASPEEPSVLRRCDTYYADDEPLQVVTTYIRWADAEVSALCPAAHIEQTIAGPHPQPREDASTPGSPDCKPSSGHKPVPDAHSVPASLHALDDASGPALRIHPQHTRYYGSCCSGAHVKHGRSASDNVTGCVLPNYPLWDRLRRRAHPPVARWSPCRATGSTTLRACRLLGFRG